MKVMQADSVTFIYPFVEQENDVGASERLIIWPNGSIKLLTGDLLLDTKAARTLAEALLHASEIAKNGQK